MFTKKSMFTTEKGDRIVLVRCSDPHTKLKAGDYGTVTSVRIDVWDDFTIGVSWDSGSSLSLIAGHDHWDVV